MPLLFVFFAIAAVILGMHVLAELPVRFVIAAAAIGLCVWLVRRNQHTQS